MKATYNLAELSFFLRLRHRREIWSVILSFVVVGTCFPHRIFGQTVVRLNNGLQLEGGIVEFASINADPFSAGSRSEVEAKPIWMIDDGLRRIYIHQRAMVESHQPADAIPDTVIRIWQPVADGGNNVSGAGAILKVSPFNSYGRRLIEIRANHSPISMLQGISELTPHFARVESLKGNTNFVWDMRMATSAIPLDQLQPILQEQLQDKKNVQARLELVRFYLQAEMYSAAVSEMDAAIQLSPESEGLKTQRRAILQQQLGQILDEAMLRAASGQQKLAMVMLENFPQQGVADETKIRVEQAVARIVNDQKLASSLLMRLSAQVQELDPASQQELAGILQEMHEDLTPDTLVRLDDYQRLGDEATLPRENRIALAIGGWILGPGAGMQNLSLTRSLVEVRRKVQEYLQEVQPARRKALLEEIKGLEGGTPTNVAKMLPWIRPPFAAQVAAETPIAGLYQRDFEVGGETVRYAVQLPPEYHPLRRYPCVVALPPSGGSLEGEIDWWAGPYEEKIGMRAGQATRHGFIVLCPQWNDGLSYQYGYTAREHQRVLASLRDAQRHFSIDTDRVFIAGHGEGASAAWDIVGSHPDLWAGLVAIGGESRKFVKLYWENLKNVPLYFVTGEIAGTPNPLVRNGDTLNRYMRPQFECMVVSYRGRGEEHFYEEIHHIFDWLQLKSHRRKPPPQDLANVVFRQGDQLFWWLEALELKENIAINPLLWDYTKIGAVPQLAAAVINPTTVRITKAPASRMAVLLQPEMGVDMQERITINWGGRRATTQPGGNLEVMLEDVRQRADRQHPVWDRIEMP